MKEIIDDNGVRYWIGEDAKNNWEILTLAKKQPGSGDWLWFHLDGFSSAYVIICASANTISKVMIGRAADLCKSHSKYRDIPKIGVIYTELKHVKKTQKTGQVITHKTRKTIV